LSALQKNLVNKGVCNPGQSDPGIQADISGTPTKENVTWIEVGCQELTTDEEHIGTTENAKRPQYRHGLIDVCNICHILF
jgi:hypothetical protein